MDKRLWEIDHSYYMTEGNFFQGGCHEVYRSWAEFIDAEGNSDLDLNYVVRWDWLEGDDYGAGEYTGDPNYRNGRFMVQFVGQRKALLRSVEVEVCRNDEPAVIAYIQPRFEYMKELWAPFV